MKNLDAKCPVTFALVMHKTVLGLGPAPELEKFLRRHTKSQIVYITHPLLFIKESYKLSSTYIMQIDGIILDRKIAYHWQLPEAILLVKDFIYTCVWIIGSKKKMDIYFGFDCLNAFTGLCLKFLGRVKIVIYYGVDYFPTRYSNPLLNYLYHLLDRICVKYCDETWNVSSQMKKARAEKGMKSDQYSRQYTVPMGIWFDEINRVSLDKIDHFSMFYIGTLIDYMGVDMVIRALPEIIKKFPKTKLDIVGIGEDKDRLMSLSNRLRLNAHIRFHGMLTEGRKREMLFKRSAIGLALFNTKILDDKVKNADPAKLKEYISYGMPIIVTDAIAHTREIRKARCGIVIPYEEGAFIQAVSKLFSDTKQYALYRSNALTYAHQFDWNSIFKRNIERIMKL